MPHMNLELKATKYTSREGDHPDDISYIEQIKGEIEHRISELGFLRFDIKLEFAP